MVENGSLAQNGCGKLSAFTDDVLDKIKDFGYTHIWYTGLLEHATQTDYTSFDIRADHADVVKGKAGSPYAIKDYYDIDPDLADDVPNRMQEFEALVERTHNAGLKLIMDFVPNHVARAYHSDAKPSQVEDLGAGDNIGHAFNPQNNFYYLPGQKLDLNSLPGMADQVRPDNDYYTEFPAKATGDDCFSAHPNQFNWYETVKLNYGVDYQNNMKTYFSPVPDTWRKMLHILQFWAEKGVDGFRCDMAEMVPVNFWAWAILQIKESYPKLLFIAEVYNPHQYRNYLENGQFDYLYDKAGLYDTLRAVTTTYKPVHTITDCWQSVENLQPHLLNFLENHDEQRIASDFFAAKPERGRPALVISATMNTNPFMVYFGQELGERGMETEGFSGLDGRTTIFDYWNLPVLCHPLTPEQEALRYYYQRVIRLCNESKAIREGTFYDLMYANMWREGFDCNRQYAYMRYKEDELLLIVANFDEEPTNAYVLIPPHVFDFFDIEESQIKQARELLTGKEYPADLRRDEDYSVYVPANDAAIICFKIAEKNILKK
ncbi:alpha-amylase [Bacteroidia bacterium]|nr:alpha-amylase [Bacteroidia bacterium]